jgi:nucleoside-diphosphate-sugar epimerase
MTAQRHLLNFVNGGGAPLQSTKASRAACGRKPIIAELGRALVIGANRGLGLALARALASDAGTAATIATIRPQSNADELSQVTDAQIMELDVRDRDQVFSVLADAKADVVFSCFGGSATDDNRPDYPGNQNLIDAAEKLNVKRFVLLSALGASDSESSVPFQVMITMRPLLLDKSRAELYLKESKLDWTIVRPVPLSDEPKTGTGMLTSGLKCYGTISRDDLAELLIRAADSVSANRATLTAIDRTRVLLTSPYVRPLEFWEPLPVEEFELS